MDPCSDEVSDLLKVPESRARPVTAAANVPFAPFGLNEPAPSDGNAPDLPHSITVTAGR
jgi:hypothetical protein